MTTLLLILAAAVALLLAYAAVRPAQFSLARSTAIAAPPDQVFALINDLRQFNTWNVWSGRRPARAACRSPPPNRPGAWRRRSTS
jgi:uncharacterized protein YndB with AHSA1/START domain